MMQGQVLAHYLLLPVPFRLLGQPDIVIEFIIDTGFIGMLALPLATIQALNLPFDRDIFATLADGSTIQVDIYLATILWLGGEQRVEVLAMGERPLLGTLLLDGCNLFAQITERGSVSVNRPSP